MNNEFYNVACDICGASEIKVLLKLNKHDVVKCLNCGLRFLNPLPAETDLKQYYTDAYYNGGYKDGYQCYLEEEDQYSAEWDNKIIEMEKLRDKYGLGNKVLEVGCGPGLFLKRLKEKGWECTGVEFSEWSSKYARDNFNLNVITGNVFELNSDNDKYDFVIMWDTIEHLINPSVTLLEIHRILKKGGVLQLTTGQVEDLHEKLASGYSMWYVEPAHIYYYSIKTIKKLLLNTGFKNISIDTSIIKLKTIITMLLKKIIYFIFDRQLRRASTGSMMIVTAIK